MITTPSDSFTRPANTTAYASGDLVANSTTAGEVEPLRFQATRLAGRGKVVRGRLHKDDDTVTAANFTLHLWSAAPVPTNGDNGALAVDKAATYLGSIAFDMTSAGFSATDGLSQRAAPSAEIFFDLGNDRALYGLLEAEAGYEPASGEVFTATLEIEG